MVRLLHKLMSRAGERKSADRSKEVPCISTKNGEGDIIQMWMRGKIGVRLVASAIAVGIAVCGVLPGSADNGTANQFLTLLTHSSGELRCVS